MVHYLIKAKQKCFFTFFFSTSAKKPFTFFPGTRDEFGPKFFGPGLKWAMEILARPGHGPKSMLAFGPGRAWAKFKIDGPGWARPKFENILKKITFSLVFQFKIAKYDVFHNFYIKI